MKTWMIVAAALALGAVEAPAQFIAVAQDDAERIGIIKDLEATRSALLPEMTPPSAAAVKHTPALELIKKAALGARTKPEIAKAKKDLNDWKYVVLRDLHAGERRAGMKEGYNEFAARKAGEINLIQAIRTQFAIQRTEASLAGVRQFSMSKDPFAWNGFFDRSSSFGGTTIPFAAAAADGAVKAEMPTGAARYDKIRRLLLSQGVSKQIVDLAIAEGLKQKVDPMIVLSVINQESNFRKTAYNKGSGCVGLMQLDPATAADMGVRGNLFDPAANIKAGVKYLNWIANSFFRMNQDLSDMAKVPADKMKMILASYNWGIGNVRNAVRKHGAAALDRVAPKETRNYISEIPSRIYDWFASF
ncbi:MAG: lytic transglycosylase domain-containing protein [Elusimicrobiota bacterium]|nr:MAG: lytic transglycosylase domain-containing protein [Elusimicrobiota bacterium]